MSGCVGGVCVVGGPAWGGCVVVLGLVTGGPGGGCGGHHWGVVVLC